ncbi:MAG: hypothetical protein O3B41_05870 [Bacteroidetes bacterium]|nr:hypothetical protein [Bacteroidota bacterium]
MTNISKLISINSHLLGQCIEMIETIGEDAYTKRQSPIYTSSIGEHVRHLVEHFHMLLSGIAAGTADYDARLRDLRISTDPSFAISTIRHLQQDLERLSILDKPLDVRLTLSPDLGENVVVSQSSLCRELQYLQAHTVHHFALIAMILRLQGLDPEADFGVAPSTLLHRKVQVAL